MKRLAPAILFLLFFVKAFPQVTDPGNYNSGSASANLDSSDFRAKDTASLLYTLPGALLHPVTTDESSRDRLPHKPVSITCPPQDTFTNNKNKLLLKGTAAMIYDDSSGNEFLPRDKFLLAGTQRYMADGSLPRLSTEIKPVTASILGGVVAASVIALHIHQANAWWKNQRSFFHFQEDFVSAMQVDKCGHAFGGYYLSYGMDEALKSSGVAYDASAFWASTFAAAYQTYVEVEDGFATDWGFSPSDWYFDMMGPAFYLAQHYVPALQNITPKWQYVPSELAGRPVINRPRTPIDDYNSSTFWYSINVYNILPQQYKKYWVPWLDISIGYGADAIDAKIDPNGPPDQYSKRRYVIGIDWNLRELLPDGGTFWNWVKQSINYIKLPSPAFEFSHSGTKFYIAYPFNIRFNSFRL
jgi:hypothetical protein